MPEGDGLDLSTVCTCRFHSKVGRDDLVSMGDWVLLRREEISGVGRCLMMLSCVRG